MAINTPIRLGIKQDGAQKGYAEALDVRGATVSMDGPIARISFGSGAYTTGTTASFDTSIFTRFSSQVQGLAGQVQSISSQVAAISAATAAAHDRNVMWMQMGVYVSNAPPVNPCQYSEWLNGSSAYWAWIRTP